MYRHKIILILCVLTEISTKTRFSVMAALICIFSIKYLCDLYRNCLVRFFTPKNMCIDTKIISIPCAVTEILTKKTEFSVMAALICILCGLPKDDRVASSRFLKSTSRRYINSKKTLYGPYCKVVQKSGVWQPDYVGVQSGLKFGLIRGSACCSPTPHF